MTAPRRFAFQFNLSTIFWLMLVTGIGLAWWTTHRQQEERLERIERLLFTKPDQYWSALKAVGPPDEVGFGPNAWCPAQMDQGEQWLLLEYDAAVIPTTVEAYETYSTEALKKVSFLDARDQEFVVWSGIDPSPIGTSPSKSAVPVTGQRKTKKIKVYLDTDVTGWNCIDAVGLKLANGKTVWAKSAVASSDYGQFMGSVPSTLVFPQPQFPLTQPNSAIRW